MKMKKWLSAFLAVVLVVTAIPVSNLLVRAEETARTAVNTSDDDWANYIKANVYAINDAKRLGATYGDLRWDYPSLYSMRGTVNGTNGLTTLNGANYRWPYVALKVTAAQQGDYQISASVWASGNTSATDTIGMLVDGVVHVLNCGTAANQHDVNATVSLSAGTHIIVFTSPMPENPSKAKKEDSTVYPWLDYCGFTIDEALTFESAPTTDEVIASLGTCVEAEAIASEENSGYVTYNNFLVNASAPEADSLASGGFTLGGVKNSVITQETDTFSTYLDKKGAAYVQYTVNAEEAGKYHVRVGAYAGISTDKIETEKPQIIIMANDTVQSKQFTGEWNTFGAVDFVVDLVKGQNIIRCIADKTTYNSGGWINQDFLEVQSGLTPVQNGVVDTFNGEDTKVLYNYYNDAESDGSLGGIDTSFRSELPDIDSFQYASENASKLPWTAFKVSNDEAGYYDISVGVTKGGDTSSNKIGIVVDGKAKVLQFTAPSSVKQMVNASVYLSEGEHIILFTTAIPENRLATRKAESTYYPWFNFDSFSFDDGIEVTADFGASENLEANKQKVYASLGTRVEAEDTKRVTYSGYDGASLESPSSASGNTVGGVQRGTEQLQSYEQVSHYLDKTQMAYVQYTVEAPVDGEYEIRVGYLAGGEGTKPFATVLVNDKAYKAQFAGEFFAVDAVKLKVSLVKGQNIVRVTSVTTEQDSYASTYINQDFLDVPAEVSVISNGTITENKNADDTTIVYANNYTDNTTNDGNLEGSNRDGMKNDSISIETMEEKAYASIEKWCFTALKLNAAKAGYYDVSLTANMNGNQASTHIGVFVNGKTYGKGYTKPIGTDEFTIDLSMYLEEGENIIVMTTPIPLSATDEANYPWFNFHKFTLDDGIELLAAPTLEEVRSASGNKIEAEDAKYVKYSLFDSFSETNNNAPGEIMVGGVATNELKVATYDQISEYTDSKTPYAYVQYAVNAPRDGEYTIRVNSFIGCTVLPFVSVLVNGNAYKAQFENNWVCDSSTLVVALHKGINYIRVSSVTADQTDVLNGSNKWINHNYLEVPKGVTPVLVSDLPTDTIKVDAWDTSQVLIRNYKNISSGEVGGVDVDALRTKRLSFENILEHFDSLAYTAIKVNAEKDGYYSIFAQIKTNENVSSAYVPVIVDGTRVCALQISKTGSKQTYGGEISLQKGEHTLLFATPMPLTADEANQLDKEQDTDGNWNLKVDSEGNEVWTERSTAYPWFNYYDFTLGNGLQPSTVPTIEEATGDAPALGDVNHDGAINDEDTEAIRKYIVGIEVIINLTAADTNEDTIIDVRDLIAEKKIMENIQTAPTAYVSDMNEELAIQESDYITTYAYDKEAFDSSGNVIEIDSSTLSERKIDGFGASFTDTSAYVLNKIAEKDAASVEEVIKNLFDKENGVGLSMIRNCIGSSDFVPDEYGYYTYQDNKDEEFALAGGETENILKYTLQALKENKGVKVILSPWTAPLWMKTEVLKDDNTVDYEQMWLSISGSSLKEECYDDYAVYLANAVKAYEDAGIPVHAITPQNEPFTNNNWVGMSWKKPSDDLLNLSNSPLIKFTNLLKKTLEDNKLYNTKILNLDYNYDADGNALFLMANTSNTTDGLAFHWYKGQPETMKTFSEIYPDKLIYVTEASSGSTAKKYMDNENMTRKTTDIVRALRSGAQAYVSWNVAVSTEGGPTYNDINEHCFGLLSCDMDTGNIEYTKDYYALAHFSKFIAQDAVVVDSTDTGSSSEYSLVNVVTKNPDGSMTAIIVNSDLSNDKVCKMIDKEQNRVMEVKVEPRSTVTITWKP